MAKTRKWDPVRLGEAVQGQSGATATWLAGAADLVPDMWLQPSSLPGWTIEDLARHLTLAVGRVAEYAAEPPPAERDIDAVSYLGGTAAVAEEVAARARDASGGPSAPEIPAELARAGEAAARVAHRAEPDRLTATRLGAMRLADFLATRCVEVVVHTRDLARSLEPLVGTGQYPPYDEGAVRAAVTLLLDALASTAPGESVEVRVPPFAAMQCVPGPRHTRGTPSNTVETDPGTWLDLATGRLNWEGAVADHRVVVSGVRADLSPWLPVMA